MNETVVSFDETKILADATKFAAGNKNLLALIDDAKKNLVEVSLVNGTLPHEYTTNFGSSKVILKPAVEGTGIIAGGAVRPVLELAGVKNVTAKTLGSRNSRNIVYATVKALQAMRTPEEVAKLRGKTVEEILK